MPLTRSRRRIAAALSTLLGFALPAVTLPAVTPPAVTPPAVTPPAVTLRTVTLRTVTLPAVALPAVTPRTAAPPATTPLAAAPDDAGVRWAVQPSGPDGPDGRDWFTYHLAPGTEVVDFVGVTNLGDTTVDFSVYATDAYTTDDGSFALLPAADQPRDLGAWITLDAGRYRVPPGSRLDIPFRMAVPANASPGDHAGGIIAAVTARQTGADRPQIDLDRRVAARAYLRVAGPTRPAVRVESLDLAHTNPVAPWTEPTTTITYVVRNTGNLRVTGTTRVRVAGPFGWRLTTTEDVVLPELLPGSTLTVTETVSGLAPAGRLTATVEASAVTADGPLPPVTRTGAVWAVPWLLLAALLAVLVLGGRWWRRHLRRRRAVPLGRAGTGAGGDGGRADGHRGTSWQAPATAARTAPATVPPRRGAARPA